MTPDELEQTRLRIRVFAADYALGSMGAMLRFARLPPGTVHEWISGHLRADALRLTFPNADPALSDLYAGEAQEAVEACIAAFLSGYER